MCIRDSFSAVQRAMSQKKEHSIRGRQYTKWKRTTEEQEEPAKKSRQLKKKGTARTAKTKKSKQEDAEKTEQGQGSSEESQGDESPDVPWTKAWSKVEVGKELWNTDLETPPTQWMDHEPRTGMQPMNGVKT